MLNFLGKGSKLIVIFIFTVIVTGSILTYLSITHISNYRELLEKKISEEERSITNRFSSDFQFKMDSLTLMFSDYLKYNTSEKIQGLKKFDSIKELINYISIDSNGVYLIPNFTNNKLLFTRLKPSKIYLDRLRTAEKNEFNSLDFKRAENFYLRALKVAVTNTDSTYVYNSMGRLYVKMNLQKKSI